MKHWFSINQRPRKLWGKFIYSGEGVVFEKKFKTEGEAEAFKLGVDTALREAEAADYNENPLDDYFACTHHEEARPE